MTSENRRCDIKKNLHSSIWRTNYEKNVKVWRAILSSYKWIHLAHLVNRKTGRFDHLICIQHRSLVGDKGRYRYTKQSPNWWHFPKITLLMTKKFGMLILCVWETNSYKDGLYNSISNAIFNIRNRRVGLNDICRNGDAQWNLNPVDMRMTHSTSISQIRET